MPENDEPEVEYLGAERSADTRARRRGRSRGVVAVAALGVLAVTGAGAYGLAQLMGGGDAPATAVPADALAYLSLDLDPSAEQKVEALKTLRKFPAIKEDLGLGSEDDLRRWMFESVTEDGSCEDLDFDDDIDGWLGSRIAISVVPGDDEPVPFGVIEVKDEAKATAGLSPITECADEAAPGSAFVGSYLVLAETDAVAAQIASDAEQRPLSEDGDFTRWIEEAGGAGLLTGFVAAEAPQVAFDAFDEEMSDRPGGAASTMGLNPLFPSVPDSEQLQEQLEEFEGAAVVMRLDDSALEVQMAASALGPEMPAELGDSRMGMLPGSTAVAFGVGVHEDAAADLFEAMADSMGQEELDSAVAEAEARTGLSLPEDLQTLLGDGVAVALDSSVDLGSIAQTGNVMELPLGLRINGDPGEVVPLVEKVIAAAGAEGMVVVETGDDVVAVGLDPEHVAALTEDGGLAGEDTFEQALPEFQSSSGAFYVDFDAGDWLTGVFEAAPDAEETRRNVEPLSGLGISGRTDGDVAHGLVRLLTE